MNHTKALFTIINRALTRTDSTLSYDRVTQAVIKLAEAVNADPKPDWYLGEGDGEGCTLADLIVGAYWHYAECHRGPSSPEYAALSALGDVFAPGCTCSADEEENVAYQALAAIVESEDFRQ